MVKNRIYSTLISLICCTSLYSMNKSDGCDVSQAKMAEPKQLTEEQHLKALVDRWHWNISLEQAGRLDRLMRKFSEQRGLFTLHPTIEEEVHKAFKVCKITEPVLVFQDQNSTNSACHALVDENFCPVISLTVGVSDKRGDTSLPLIRHVIFHECGHIVAGDVDQNSRNNFLKNLALITTLFSAGIYTGIRTAKALDTYPTSVCVLGGIAAGLTSLTALGRLYDKTINAYQTRKIERNADIFAAQKLIDLHDYHALANKFLDFTYNCNEGNFNMNNEYWLFHDHPGYLDRARIILDAFKKAHVNFNNLPIDEKEHPDKHHIQQRFSRQVKNYFPKYLAE